MRAGRRFAAVAGTLASFAAAASDAPSALSRSGVESFLPYSIGNVRGLDAGRMVGVYRWNGLPVLGQSRGAAPGTDRFEVLTGLAALDAGYVVPGGLVERLDKAPAGRAATIGGALHHGRLLELTGDFSATAGPLGVRVNLSDERGGGIYDGTHYAASYASVALAARVSPTLELAGSFERARGRERGEQAAIYLDGRDAPSAPRARTLLGQTWDGTRTEDRVASLRLAWTPAETWKLKAGMLRMDGRYSSADFDGILQADGRYLARYLQDPSQRFVSDTKHVEMEGRVGGHTLRFGASGTLFRAYRAGTESVDLGLSSIDTPTAFAPGAPPANGPQIEAQRLRDDNWFVSDSLRLNDRWTVLGSLRGGRYRENGANVVEPADERYLLKSFGVRYAPSPRTTFYASSAEALELGGTAPLAAVNAERVLPSRISHQWEAGVRFAVTPRLGLEAAVFEARRLYEYEDAARFYRQDGTVAHRGLEMKVVGSTGGLTLYANVLALDPRVRGASNPAVDGKLAVNVPRIRGNLIAESKLPWEGWSASVNFNAYGPRMADAVNRTHIPGYGVFGAGVAYEHSLGKRGGGERSVTLRLDVDNLADRGYWEDASSGYLSLGGPRSVHLRAAMRM